MPALSWHSRIYRVVAVTAAFAATSATAQQFPDKSRNVTFVVSYTAGGPTDLATRIVAETLSKQLGLSIQVVNRAGGNTLIGVHEVVRAKPDGYTLNVTSSSTTTMNYLNPDNTAQFGRKDFKAVAPMARDPQFIYISADTPLNDMKQVVEFAKAKPGALKWGINANLVPTHVLALLIENTTGARFTFVPYPGGAQTMTAVAGGEINIAGSSAIVGKPYVESKKMKVIAAVDEGPQNEFPGVLSAVDQGFRAKAQSVYGFVAPAATPPAVIQYWNSAIAKALDDPALQQKFAAAGLIPTKMPVTDYERHWDEAEKASTETLDIFKKRKADP